MIQREQEREQKKDKNQKDYDYDHDHDHDLRIIKEIKDPIHDAIPVSCLALSIIDTPEYQSLRKLCQLGTAFYVFPSANHKRFEHCLGVYYLTKKYLEHLTSPAHNYDLDLDHDRNHFAFHLTPRVKELICISGLVHDLGHCVGSHIFDNYFCETYNVPKHEERSQLIFRSIVQKYKLNFSEDEIDFICSLITGHPLRCGYNYPQWVYQIVSNQFFELDTDKLDYLQRDSYYTGIPCYLQIERIFHNCRISDDAKNIIFNKKIFPQVYDVFMSRYRLHRDVYRHHAVIAVELLIVEYLKKLFEIPLISNLLRTQNNWSFFSDDLLSFADQLLKLNNYYNVNDEKEKNEKNDDTHIHINVFNTEWWNTYSPILIECSKIKNRLENRKLPKLIKHTSETDETEIVSLKNIKLSLGMCSSNINPITKILFYEIPKMNKNEIQSRPINVRNYQPNEISQMNTIHDHEDVILTYKIKE
jgi:HD superfamily phosphohydrolase